MIVQTKFRARHCNDNALVECKNGWVIRKNMGHFYVDSSLSNTLNSYYLKYFNIYLNYHRPCLFETAVRINSKGRHVKVYGQATTPYEKLKELSNERNINFLKPKITFGDLDEIAYAMGDNEFAKVLRKEEDKVFNLVFTHKNATT